VENQLNRGFLGMVNRILAIAGMNLKYHFMGHMMLAMLITCLVPVVFGIRFLDAIRAALPLEMMLSLIGPVLLTPVFMPEQDRNILDLMRSKKMSYGWVCIIRLFYSLLTLAVLVGGFVWIMKSCESDVSVEHFVGGMASALFLGSLGFVVAGISNNVTAGYMVAVGYYFVNLTVKEKLGNWYLFSMTQDSFEEKYWLLGTAAFLMAGVFVLKKIRWKVS